MKNNNSRYSTSYALILAAGKGTRMPSTKPKVLQKLMGDTMLACVYDSLKETFDERIFTLVGYEKEQVLKELESISNNAFKNSIEQVKLQGTGQAFKEALPTFQENNADFILVVNADVPLIPADMISNMLDKAIANTCDILFATIEVEDIAQYGRIVRDKDKKVQGIVEAKDYNIDIHGTASNEINAGLYIFSSKFAEEYLPLLSNNNANNEFYITDLIKLGIENNKNVQTFEAGFDFRLLGANNPYELYEAEEYLRKERTKKFMQNGVILHNPSTITIGKDVKIEAGVEICANCEFYGNTQISFGTVIKSHCVFINTSVGKNCKIRSYCHFENAKVNENCAIGPYARLRPDAQLANDVHIGNFVEIKKSILGNKTKVNHLSYIGDSEIGSETNVGAGTITCNYDGVNKHKTIIGDKCFIGSNTALVAPINLGNEVLVGAGTVVTKDVEDNMLVLARAKQVQTRRK